MFLCAITDRRLAGDQPAAQREGLVALARTWAENGVAVVQLREKDLPAPELIALAQAMHQAIRQVRAQTGSVQMGPAPIDSRQINSTQINPRPRLVLNAPPAVALAAGADGVHLPAGLLATQPLDEIRSLFAAGSNPSIGHLASQHHSTPAGYSKPAWISVSCHTFEEVEQARKQQVDYILFAPVFEKMLGENQLEEAQSLPGVGLAALAQACRVAHPVPVLALGGVTADNAAACIAAGAHGIGAIRLFHASPRAWSSLL